MLTYEQSKILGYLHRHTTSRLSDLVKTCLPGASPEWAGRVLSDLEWLGYVVVYSDSAGEPVAVQPTEKELRCTV